MNAARSSREPTRFARFWPRHARGPQATSLPCPCWINSPRGALDARRSQGWLPSAFHQAREWDRRTHVAGRHGGRLGHAALQVLHCLIFDFLSFKTGRLDPSYEAIAAKANLARSTVAEALKRLRASGILHWLRRCEESYEDGRYVLRQVSNAYAVLPPSLWRHAGILAPEAPTLLQAPGAITRPCRTWPARLRR